LVCKSKFIPSTQHSQTLQDIVMKSASQLVSEANQTIETLAAEDVIKLMDDGSVVFIDLREHAEIEKGFLPGAVHVPRGLLEFQADAQSPSHNPRLGPDKRLVLYCGSGGRSALGAKTLKDMGFTNVAHVAGGFPALQQALGVHGKTERCEVQRKHTARPTGTARDIGGGERIVLLGVP
jgi:rhodanese-related sulfurtransferase